MDHAATFTKYGRPKRIKFDRRHACDRCNAKPVIVQRRLPGRHGFGVLLCAECEDRRKLAVSRALLDWFGLPHADERMSMYADELAGKG